MKMKSIARIFLAALFALIASSSLQVAFAEQDDDARIDEQIEEELLDRQADAEEEENPLESPLPLPEAFTGRRDEGELAEEVSGEGGRQIKISGVVIMNYVFENSADSFTVKYRWELKGEANADTAVIKGDVDMEAEVDGFLAKWPTGECKLDISIPKVPFELTYKKTGEEKGDLRLSFKKPITEDWSSKCSFTDTPGAKLETSGPPEKWLAKALEKARPPLRSIVIEVKDEETTTPLVIGKETISDAPIGTMEIEGTASVTVSP